MVSGLGHVAFFVHSLLTRLPGLASSWDFDLKPDLQGDVFGPIRRAFEKELGSRPRLEEVYEVRSSIPVLLPFSPLRGRSAQV